MSQTSAAEIARLAEALSAQDRLALIDRLCSGLADEDMPLTPAQVAELRRRDARFDAELAAARPWDEVLAELARRTP
jgi:putative addiction module component (TIGR02574 family)